MSGTMPFTFRALKLSELCFPLFICELYLFLSCYCFSNLILCVWEFCLHVSVHGCGVHGGQQRAIEPLELEL